MDKTAKVLLLLSIVLEAIGWGLGLMGIENPIIGRILVGFGVITFVVLVVYLFKKPRKVKRPRKVKQQKPLPVINYEGISNVTPQDKIQIESMDNRMMATHGHWDLEGLLSDRANGVPLNELMARACSKCGTPRNKRGKV
ncbi:hypothetical protein ACFLWS_06180 [Chloroflexota bacterium]